METTQQVAAEQGSPRKGVTGGTNIGFIKIDWEFFFGGVCMSLQGTRKHIILKPNNNSRIAGNFHCIIWGVSLLS